MRPPPVADESIETTELRSSASVALEEGTLRIGDLEITGAAADAAAQAVEDGRDLAEFVTQMLHVGAMVLLHGANVSVVDAVTRELRRSQESQQALRAARNRMSAKGLSFEELLAPVLDSAFAPYGDIVEDTSGTPGPDGRDKKGDFTVTLNPSTVGGAGRRIVVEAKDKPGQRLTGKDGALTYLDDAMRNRQAAAGVLVCATPTPALAEQRIRVYPHSRILVLLDKEAPDPLALEVACHLARTMATQATDADAELIGRH